MLVSFTYPPLSEARALKYMGATLASTVLVLCTHDDIVSLNKSGR